MTATGRPLRIGILGCARIAPLAMVRPAKREERADVVAVASRRIERARKWAARHGVPRAYGSYDDLLADPNVDAVYNPLPNALHAEWTIRAMEAGKHVLCEKPLASNETEAKEMAAAARRTGLVGMEAFHYRYHPVFERVLALVAGREIGELRRVEAEMRVPLLLPGDIRWDADLAGGAVMDLGCYVVHMARQIAPGTPFVQTASGVLIRRGVDRSFEAALSFTREVDAVVRGSLLGSPWSRLRVTGTRGEVDVVNPTIPQLGYRLRVTVDGVARTERVERATTYGRQLAAFVAAVRDGTSVPTDFDDAVDNMRVLDQIRQLIGVRT